MLKKKIVIPTHYLQSTKHVFKIGKHTLPLTFAFDKYNAISILCLLILFEPAS